MLKRFQLAKSDEKKTERKERQSRGWHLSLGLGAIIHLLKRENTNDISSFYIAIIDRKS